MMQLDYQHLLPEDYDEKSRVWIYQGSRLLMLSEALSIEPLLEEFAQNWSSHGADVKASAFLFFGQFIVLVADETKAGVSGCSTDSSVRFVKSIGERFGVDFFNRTQLAFFVRDKIQTIPLQQFSYAAEHGFINPQTLYFNNTVLTLKDLKESWIIPIEKSWLASRLPLRNA